jgi:hypothetical protein
MILFLFHLQKSKLTGCHFLPALRYGAYIKTMKKHLLFSTIIIFIYLSIDSQPLHDSLFNVKINHRAFPLNGKFYHPAISKPVYDGNKIHLLISGFYNKLHYFETSTEFDKSVSGPLVLSYDSNATLLSTKKILTQQYNVLYMCKTQNTFLACGRYSTCDADSCYSYYNGRNHSMAFVAEFSGKFDLLKIELFPGMIFWKLLKYNNSVYVTGEMLNKEIEIKGKKYKSHVEIRKDAYDGNERDYPDIVLLKLNKEFEVEKFAHFAIDGTLQDGESIVVNKNGYVAVGINTCILRGPDHHDGNLYLVDSSFKLLWHKQYTDLMLGRKHSTVLNINEKNEVLSYVGSYYAMESNTDSMLPDYSKKEKSKFPFEGVVVYNEKGKIKHFESTEVPLGLAFEKRVSSTEIENTSHDEKRYLRFHKFNNDSTVTLSFYNLNPEGKIYPLTRLPEKLPLIFYYNSYINTWELVSLRTH